MSRVKRFRLPDLGEGLTEGEILQWLVQPGDEVQLNQPIVEVETAKAAVELPSPYSGVVLEIHCAAGETVDVGTPIISVDTEPTAGRPEPAAPDRSDTPVETGAAQQVRVTGPHSQVAADTIPAAAAHLVDTPPPDGAVEPGLVGSPAPAAAALIGETGPTGRTATLVGYGPRSGRVTRRPRSDRAAPPPTAVPPTDGLQTAGPAPTEGPPMADEPPPAATAARVSAAAVGQAAAARSEAVAVLAKPPIRRLARDLGVDLAALAGTGAGGVITRADVEAAAAPAKGRGAPAEVPGAPTTSPAFDPVTRERRVPVKGVRKHTAAAMVASAFTAPHVTEFLTLDVTPTMRLRERAAALPEFAGVKVTPLLFVAKALLLAVSRHPEVNASWDEAAQELVVKDYVNLGIAADTPRGLLVPNVKDADQLALPELARALQALAETARAGRTTPADLAGGTITITNVGMFGVDNGTPILNPGESAILCFGAIRPMPWVVENPAGEPSIAIRQVTQLALSFDHRSVDGALGSRFLADVGRVLSDPTTALVWC